MLATFVVRERSEDIILRPLILVRIIYIMKSERLMTNVTADESTTKYISREYIFWGIVDGFWPIRATFLVKELLDDPETLF